MGYKSAEAQREYQREWIAARRAEFFKDKKCVRCGSRESLELDHIDPSMKVDHKIWSWSQERRDEEIAKCQVLCKPCHVEKTGADIEPPHGTNSRYTSKKWKCRCELCKWAHTALARRRRQGQ